MPPTREDPARVAHNPIDRSARGSRTRTNASCPTSTVAVTDGRGLGLEFCSSATVRSGRTNADDWSMGLTSHSSTHSLLPSTLHRHLWTSPSGPQSQSATGQPSSPYHPSMHPLFPSISHPHELHPPIHQSVSLISRPPPLVLPSIIGGDYSPTHSRVPSTFHSHARSPIPVPTRTSAGGQSASSLYHPSTLHFHGSNPPVHRSRSDPAFPSTSTSGQSSSQNHLATQSFAPSTLHFDGSHAPIHRSRSGNEGRNPSHTWYSTHHELHSVGSPGLLQPSGFPHRYEPPVTPPGASFLTGARYVQTGDWTVNNVNTVGRGGSVDGWQLLLEKTAPNALHNSRARFDAPKCDEDTRIEVTQEIMAVIQDREAPQRILCMTGAAGSGKSALQQTVAEKCSKLGVLGAAFFFSSTDSTRNIASPVVPTIAYQLGLKHHCFKDAVIAAVQHDPLIFSQSLRSQMEVLIVHPFRQLQRNNEIDSNAFPYIILIDGLDECQGESIDTVNGNHLEAGLKRSGQDRQTELLDALQYCIIDNNLPFRVFIASRPEMAIRTALEPGGQLHEIAYHIRLSDEYDATEDMRRYLRRRFGAIGLQIHDPNWFTEDNIETLVQAASGQFVYVATVFKFISKPRDSPAKRLKIVLTWTPAQGQVTRPFEGIDILYRNILVTAKIEYEAVDTHRGHDFLLLFNAFCWLCQPKNFTATVSSIALGLEPGAEYNIVSDLRSLVSLEEDEDGDLRLHMYHKSFPDFLEEEDRAGDLFVPESRIRTYVAKYDLRLIVECPLDVDSLPGAWEDFPISKLHREALELAVDHLAFDLSQATGLDDEVVEFTQKGGWPKLSKLQKIHRSLYNSDDIGWFTTWLGDFEVRQPETAAAIRPFIEEFDRLRKEEEGGDSDA